MTKSQMLEIAMKQVALEMSCAPECFKVYENSAVISELYEDRRMFSTEKDFFRMATFGCGAVLSVDEKIVDWCNENLISHEGIRLFEPEFLYRINTEIQKYGKSIIGSSEFYLTVPKTDRMRELRVPAVIKWYEKDEIPALYSDKRFKNAIMYDVNSLRPDILAVTATMDGQIAAMAGASMDSKMFWQVGIDVMPEYRSNGLGTYLISALTDKILNRGAIPYYGTWSANIGSRSVALRSGYFPAWVEVYAK